MVSALKTEITEHAFDLIMTPPAEEPYTQLKTRPVKKFEETEVLKTTKLVEGCELGDRKPSALLRETRDLAGGRVSDVRAVADRRFF